MYAPLKLGFSLSRRGENFPPRTNHGHTFNSASLTEAERTIKRLEEENNVLRQELNDVRLLYKQLTTESVSECFDERRVNLLKAQVIQLERQNALLTKTISSRSETLMEVENALAATINYWQAIKGNEGCLAEIRVSCTELDRIITTLESARKNLCRMAEKTSSPHNCCKPLLWYGSFLRNKPDRPVTLFDVCCGDMEHINLKHVGRLESKLVNLYKQLMLVKNTLRVCIQSSNSESVTDVPTAVYSRLSDQVKHSCDLLEDVCNQLLQLSLLVPAAPVPALSSSPVTELTAESVVKVFGKIARTRDAKRLIDCLVKFVNFSTNHAKAENCMFSEELAFHHKIYKLQTEYIDALFPCVNKCYAEFESDMQDAICQPLREVLQIFYKLNEATDHCSLVHFIEVFRNHASTLSEAVEKLSTGVDERDGKFSEYGMQFLKKMEQNHANAKKRRDLNIARLDVVRQQLSEQTDELLQILGDSSSGSAGSPSLEAGRRSEYTPSGLPTVRFAMENIHSNDDLDNVDTVHESHQRHDTVVTPAAKSVAAVDASVQSSLPAAKVRSRPPRCDPSKPKKIVPVIAQRNLKLKTDQDSYTFNEKSKTPSISNITGNSKRNLLLTRSSSFSKDGHYLASNRKENPDIRDHSNVSAQMCGRFSADGERTTSTSVAVTRSASLQHIPK